MAEWAPGFAGGTDRDVLPKNTSKMASSKTKDALVATTVGAVAGTSTTVSRNRRAHYGSTVARESVASFEANPHEIARNSTAADVTSMKAQLGDKKPSFTFPRDLSGNGGPAFTRS